MFLRIQDLNEGCIGECKSQIQKKSLSEGLDPKEEVLQPNINGWKASKPQAHVNSKWQKLRK